VVMILGILGALVVPQFSDAARTSRESVLREDLRYLRSQIQVYAAQHDGVPPGHVGGDPGAAVTESAFVAQMTGRTTIRGQIGADPGAFPLGPYLQRMPANPINGLATIRIIAPGAWPTGASGTHGWMYQPGTLRFASDATGVDGEGTAYFDY